MMENALRERRPEVAAELIASIEDEIGRNGP
jgi:hypothetical protein